ncbi:unnamed protein product [Ambrosiozyma monospora]|uniref:Unnamed protein product n=1 Tax=Ambrosiozyma monospora TaxID=43982 RepID=A0ACB5T6J4_AMBMO|nr:unnamed protein product [Ambrosiozyma monospora]
MTNTMRPLSTTSASSRHSNASSLNSTGLLSRMNSLYSNASSTLSINSTNSGYGGANGLSYGNGGRIKLTYSNVSLQSSSSQLSMQSHSNLSNSSKDALLLTPSQKFRINQRRKKQMREAARADQALGAPNSTTNDKIPSQNDLVDDCSDDEYFPDDFPIFDVPFSKSLQSLSDHGRFEFKKPQFMKHIKRLSSNNSSIRSSTSISRGSNKSSPIARASSIFSIGSDLSEISIYNSSLSDENLSNDTKLLIKNEDLRLEETLERVAMLKKFKRVAPAQPSVIGTQSSSSQQSQKPVTPITSPTKTEYLTPTRQTNLPPKDQYESTRHMHDYSNLLEAEISKEQHDLKKHKAQQEKADKQHAKDLKTWKNDVLPHFNKAISQPSTRELWWRGVPESIRQEVWMKQCCILPKEGNSKKSKLDTILDECLDTARVN